MRLGTFVLGSISRKQSDCGNALSLHIENVMRDATVTPLNPDINVTIITNKLMNFTKQMFPLKTKLKRLVVALGPY